MNTLKRNLSRERIKITFTGSGMPSFSNYNFDSNSTENTNQNERDSHPERLKRVSSSSSISSGSKLFLNFYFILHQITSLSLSFFFLAELLFLISIFLQIDCDLNEKIACFGCYSTYMCDC